MSERTLPAVSRICHAVDGMPLAIELAAARLRTMTVEQLAARLDDRFRLLTGGSRTAPRQHRTLRAVVDWSWELLDEPERALLRRLAAFPGGATLDAAEQVCADEPGAGPVDRDQVLDLLASLVDKSLLVSTEDGRYRMLETIKAYGLERLAEADELESIRRAHAGYFTELAERAEPYLRRAEQLTWLGRLAAEHDNLTAALRGALAAGDAATAVRLAAASGWYWWLGGHQAEGAELTARAMALPGPADDGARAVACAISVLLATAGLGDERRIGDLLATARDLGRRTGDSHPLVRFLAPMDRVRAGADDLEGPARAWAELLDDPDPWVRASARLEGARALVNVGGPPAEAETRIRQALAGFRAIGERWGTSFALSVLADLVARRGDYTGALDLLEQADAVVIELGVLEDRLYARGKQAEWRWLLGDRVGSASVMARAEREARQVPWSDALAGLAHSRAELARWADRPSAARAELAQAAELVQGIAVHPVFRAMLLDSLGHLDAAEGDLASARAHRSEALALALESMHAPTLGQILVGVADQALRQGSPRQAACLLAASRAVRGGPDLSRPDPARVENAARAALGEEFTEAARSGAGLSLGTVGAVRELAAVTLGG